MSSATARLATFSRLRRELDARCASGPETAADALTTGLKGVDAAVGGGLARGALTELVFSAPSSGGQLLLLHLLQAARRTHQFFALIDGADGFDPQTIEPAGLLRNLLWVRCTGAARALQAADLLARDTNFNLLALDLRGCEPRELRRTPSTVWYRLQRVIESTDTVLAVLTPRRLVPAAQARLAFTRSLPLSVLDLEQAMIAGQLAPATDRLRTAARWSWSAETAEGTDPLQDQRTASMIPAANGNGIGIGFGSNSDPLRRTEQNDEKQAVVVAYFPAAASAARVAEAEPFPAVAAG